MRFAEDTGDPTEAITVADIREITIALHGCMHNVGPTVTTHAMHDQLGAALLRSTAKPCAQRFAYVLACLAMRVRPVAR